MTGGYGSRAGFTVGNVYLTGKEKVSDAELRHETKHADQWAISGWQFPAIYGVNAAATNNNPCKNFFEWWAGFQDAHYDQC